MSESVEEAESPETHEPAGKLPTPALFLNVFIIAICGLVYELVAGTLSSYVLGDSVTQFSLCIGIYLSALGVGAWLSGFIEHKLARCFIEVELGVALLGGISAPVLFLSFARIGDWFSVLLYGMVFGIGTLVGLELPLLMRILKENLDFKDLVSRVLTFDYIGALVGSLLFPILLLPKMGLIRTSLLFGMMNAIVGLWGTWLLRPLLIRGTRSLRLRAGLVLGFLMTAFLFADRLTTLSEERLFPNPVVYAAQSPYQRIVVTRGQKSFQLWLNGKLQFDSIDEYRYHEALVHPAMQVAGSHRKILVLGGGDGLGLREVLKYPDVQSITLVDLDPKMTTLAQEFPPLGILNQHALEDSRVKVINQDAMIWLETAEELFDVVLIDFPDPNNFALGKLYTRRFYRMLKQHLTPEGAIGIQCTSALFTRKSFWCILHTMEAAGFQVHPYQAAVPSFLGPWGFGLAKHHAFTPPKTLPENMAFQFLTQEVLQGLFVIPKDLAKLETEVNRLDNQVLVRYYER